MAITIKRECNQQEAHLCRRSGLYHYHKCPWCWKETAGKSFIVDVKSPPRRFSFHDKANQIGQWHPALFITHICDTSLWSRTVSLDRSGPDWWLLVSHISLTWQRAASVQERTCLACPPPPIMHPCLCCVDSRQAINASESRPTDR